MYFEFKDQKIGAWLRLTDNVGLLSDAYRIEDQQIHLLWNRSSKNVNLFIDDLPIELSPNQITTCTYLQTIQFENQLPKLTVFSFSREFYCIKEHDQEVSCSGLLFFGTKDVPVVLLNDQESERLNLLLKVFIDEFQVNDNVQNEMLQMLLKRLIILCTRMVRSQLSTRSITHEQVDLIRQFNVLVDGHFKKLHKVSDYAEMLFKSPKTLSNLFKQFNSKSPLALIHERIALEGKRLLSMTDKPVKEIAFDLGFKDVSSFIKIFKKIIGTSPQDYRNTLKLIN
ncbi:MAG: helix-turn-helix domain-containing protein [Reichenbachiella sp.]